MVSIVSSLCVVKISVLYVILVTLTIMDPFSSVFVPNKLNENQNGCKLYCTDDSFPPEPQNGNVEYKLKIINPTNKRFEHLITQMKWRLREGNGEAVYEIGVDDKGVLKGLCESDLQKTLGALENMAKKLKATTTVLSKRCLGEDCSIAEVLVRKIPDDSNNIEIRVAVLGNADAGKSTLLGVLTHGTLDNGKGKARLNMFRHLHEIQSGRTSSISHEILGFDSSGHPVNYSAFTTAEEICEKSTKLVSFLDLAGHKKYIKTTVHGLSGYFPHYAMLIISSSAGAIGMTQEHLSINRALKVPFFIVVTKIDLVSPQATLQTLESFLKAVGSRRVPFFVKKKEDILTAVSNQMSENVVPIFCVSCVNGEGLDLLMKFLSLLSPKITTQERELLEQGAPEFQIDEVFKSVEVGPLLAGLLTRGILTENMVMQIGPFEDGTYKETRVESVHRNRIPVNVVHAGQSAVIKLSPHYKSIRKGMVLLSIKEIATSCLYFQACISVLYHATSISPGYQTTVHIANVRQTASIVGIFSQKCIKTNDNASVVFKFKKHPEHVAIGQKLLFRDGSAKGIGEVTQVFPLSS